MKPARNRSAWSLFLCVALGIHNRRGRSRIGAVHYCSRCGIVTADDRRQGMAIADAGRFAPGKPIVFGDPGREYRAVVHAVNAVEGRLVLSRIRLIPRWRSWLHWRGAALKGFVVRGARGTIARTRTMAGGK